LTTTDTSTSKKDLNESESSIMSEAFERVKAQGYKTDLVGDACFIYSKKLLEAVDAIKKEK
jgi:hypothetical protein